MQKITNQSNYFKDVLSFISSKNSSDYVTFEEFLVITGNQGKLILCMILATPFLIPVSIPGSSIPFGIGIMFLGISIFFNKSLIPVTVLKYKISKNNVLKVLNGTIAVLNKFEKIIKPRKSFLTSNNFINGTLLVLTAFLLMLPLPVPLTDTLPAYSVFLMSASILEKDGYFIIISYILTAITIIYFSLIFILGFEGISLIMSYFGIHIPTLNY
ncbi:MAG: exopolysaccharide biosynthesis protein [Methanobacterium sp.]